MVPRGKPVDLSNDECRSNQHILCVPQARKTTYSTAERINTCLGDLELRNLDCSQRGNRHASNVDVIEPNNGYVFRHTKAFPMRSIQNPDQGHIVRVHDCCR
jgi:hypothetical protein